MQTQPPNQSYKVQYPGSAETPDLAANINALSPEGMLAYVTEMLGITDGQINDMVATLKEHKAKAAWLQHLASEMRQLKHGRMDGEKAKLVELRDEAQAKVNAAKAAGTSDPEAEKALTELKNAVDSLDQNPNKGDMNSADDDWIEQKAAAIDQQVSDLTSGTELEMINFQTMVEQRSHIIAFASKVIAAADDNVKGVIGNIR